MSLQLLLRQVGYCVARAALTESDLDAAAALLPPTGMDGGTVRMEAEVSGQALSRILTASGFQAAVRSIIGEDCVAVVNRHHHVTVDSGLGSRGTRVHRDVLHWTRSPVTALVPLRADAGDPHAWVSVIPGSHLWPIEGPRNGGGYWLDEMAQRRLNDQLVAVPMSPGDVVFMDSMLFHAAGSGSPQSPRVMAALTLRSTDELTGRVADNEILVIGSASYAGQSWWRRHDD